MTEENGDKVIIDNENDNELPLSQLQNKISSETFSWLLNAEKEEAKRQAELEDDEAANATALFDQLFISDKIGDGDEEEKEKEDDDSSVYKRVHEWCSSLHNPDGIGGINDYEDDNNDNDNNDDDDNLNEHENIDENENENALTVRYILSEASGGHGDDLWAAARHVANLFADPKKCRELLHPLFVDCSNGSYNENEEGSNNDNDGQDHPLLGKKVIELGAGAGVPSWIAMKCGSTVVCTDQAIPNRIRCMAECVVRNLYEMTMDVDISKYDLEEAEGDDYQRKRYQYEHSKNLLSFAKKSRVHPYDWGTSINEIVEILNANENIDVDQNNEQKDLFDVVLAADCIYMPDCHIQLLDSMKMLMSKKKKSFSRNTRSVGLLPFALHGNTKDENVWFHKVLIWNPNGRL